METESNFHLPLNRQLNSSIDSFRFKELREQAALARRYGAQNLSERKKTVNNGGRKDLVVQRQGSY